MNTQCPKCHSNHVGKINLAKKGLGALGMFAGTATGVAGAINGARYGSVVGFVGGPMGSITGAVVGGLFGAVTGGTVGSAVGEVIDDTVLDNYECFDCQHHFSQPVDMEPYSEPFDPSASAESAPSHPLH